jgi:alkanesulfonate monooxygenase SsuD/methylene tetrahydromethanopterin reductase-like flavin-dependent oxidoreductase (luciferase family)
MPFAPLEVFVKQRGRVLAACEAIGRSRPMTFSAALVLCAGRDEGEVARRAGAIGRQPDELRANGAAGSPEEVAATIRRWNDAGAERIYLQVLDLDDLDHLDFVAGEVVPLLS